MEFIEHKNYGRGKVKKRRCGSFELLVEFEDGLNRWVRVDDVRFLAHAPIKRSLSVEYPTLSKEAFNARHVIEMLRMGIVPHGYVEEFTIGREKELQAIKDWLMASDSGVMTIIGPYGVGKTHLLEYVYFFALKHNLAVSLVELDPNEVPLHKPKAVYQRAIATFRFKMQSGNFREFLRSISLASGYECVPYCLHKGFKVITKDIKGDLIYCPVYHMNIRQGAAICEDCKYYGLKKVNNSSTLKLEIQEHKFLGKIIKKIQIEKDDEDIWQWIEGEPGWYIYYPSMPDFSTAANIYCYLLSGIGWAAKNILGLNGLIVLFDEAESIEPYWYWSYQNEKARNFFNGLVMMANNDQRLLSDMDNIEQRFTNTGYSRGWWGKFSNLQYCARNKLPFIWKIPCHVKLIFALTPSPHVITWLSSIHGSSHGIRFIELNHLPEEALDQIARKIHMLYEKAYGFRINANDFAIAVKKVRNATRDKTRLFIKGLVEIFDLLRFHGSAYIRRLSV